MSGYVLQLRRSGLSILGQLKESEQEQVLVLLDAHLSGKMTEEMSQRSSAKLYLAPRGMMIAASAAQDRILQQIWRQAALGPQMTALCQQLRDRRGISPEPLLLPGVAQLAELAYLVQRINGASIKGQHPWITVVDTEPAAPGSDQPVYLAGWRMMLSEATSTIGRATLSMRIRQIAPGINQLDRTMITMPYMHQRTFAHRLLRRTGFHLHGGVVEGLMHRV